MFLRMAELFEGCGRQTPQPEAEGGEGEVSRADGWRPWTGSREPRTLVLSSVW